MKSLPLLTLFGFSIVVLAKTPCDEECTSTEYQSYVDCLRRRMKRSTDCVDSIEVPCEDCITSCQQCDCNFCTVNACDPSCNSCCPNNPPCTTYRCCHKACHNRCNSVSCRNECRRTCRNKVAGNTNVTIAEKTRHNITTVINLHNTINNTNVIDMPIEVNNTNVNNMTISEPEYPNLTFNNSSPQISQNACCFIVSPRQCVPKEIYPYVRCFHYRRKACGQFCRAPIIHEQPHEICDQTATGTACHQQVVYIPQPQPRCAYQSVWPYVSCGFPQQQFCGGCYQHYSPQFPQLPPYGCSFGCYDDGYGQGPYYRQGPFYRPGYAHVPSCYQTGTCNSYGFNYGGAMGNSFGFPSQALPNFGAFYGMGYPPGSYENTLHIETNPNNIVPNTNNTGNATEVNEPPPPNYYPIPVFPQYISSGYPYPPPPPPYNLPPEVDIQAIITHPEKDSRYAQITISKEKRQSGLKQKKLFSTASSNPHENETNDKPSNS